MKIYTLLSRFFCFLFAYTGFKCLLSTCLFFLDIVNRMQGERDRRDLIFKLFKCGFALSELATYSLANLESLYTLWEYEANNLPFMSLSDIGRETQRKLFKYRIYNLIGNEVIENTLDQVFERNQLDIETQELEFITEYPCKECGDYFEDTELNYSGMCFDCECKQPYKGKL